MLLPGCCVCCTPACAICEPSCLSITFSGFSDGAVNSFEDCKGCTHLNTTTLILRRIVIGATMTGAVTASIIEGSPEQIAIELAYDRETGFYTIVSATVIPNPPSQFSPGVPAQYSPDAKFTWSSDDLVLNPCPP